MSAPTRTPGERPRAVAGTYSDLKIIKTRGYAQVVIEVPLSRAEQIVEIFGLPLPDRETWVAIAPLGFDPYGADGAPAGQRHRQQQHPDQHPAAAPPADPLGQNAVTSCALRCQEVSFQRWLLGPPPAGAAWSEEDAAREVRKRLGITSRSEIATSPEARRRWKALIARYMEHTHAPSPR